MGEKKEIDLDEVLKLKEIELKIKEINAHGKESNVETIRVLREVLESTIVDTNDIGTVFYMSALTENAREIVANKIIELVKKL